MKRWTRLALLIAAGMTCACLATLALAEQPAPGAGQQGLTGKVIKMKGNFMPGPAPAPGAAATRRGETPLAVPVHVFKGKVQVFATPDPQHPALVKIVQADRNGVYKIALAPGEYTAVAEIGGKLYRNAFTMDAGGKQCWSSVTVKAGAWTTDDIKDSSEAFF